MRPAVSRYHLKRVRREATLRHLRRRNAAVLHPSVEVIATVVLEILRVLIARWVAVTRGVVVLIEVQDAEVCEGHRAIGSARDGELHAVKIRRHAPLEVRRRCSIP